MNTDQSAPLHSLALFQSIAAVTLGTILGLLIALPIAPLSASQSGSGTLLLLASGAAGALIGHRRRRSRAFLYFCFAAILILSGTITTSIIPQ